MKWKKRQGWIDIPTLGPGLTLEEKVEILPQPVTPFQKYASWIAGVWDIARKKLAGDDDGALRAQIQMELAVQGLVDKATVERVFQDIKRAGFQYFRLVVVPREGRLDVDIQELRYD